MLDSPGISFAVYMFTDPFGFCYFVLPVLLTFTGQLWLCFRAKRILPKLLPAAFGPLTMAAVYGAFLVVGENLLYLYPLGIAGLILLGSFTGWLVYSAACAIRWLKKKTSHS